VFQNDVMNDNSKINNEDRIKKLAEKRREMGSLYGKTTGI